MSKNKEAKVNTDKPKEQPKKNEAIPAGDSPVIVKEEQKVYEIKQYKHNVKGK